MKLQHSNVTADGAAVAYELQWEYWRWW